MGRPHIEFIQSLEIEPRRVEDGPFAGAHERLLSEDPDTGARTVTVTTTAGWAGELGDGERPIELFVLSGAIELDGRALRTGCYAHLPPGTARHRIAGEANVLAMIDAPAAR